MKNKYKNRFVIVDDTKFQSKDEARYYQYLKELKAKGKIKGFKLQPLFTLIENYEYFGKKRRACTYRPDFEVTKNDNSVVYIDVKSMGTATQQGEIRRKLFESKFPDLKLLWICRNLKHGDSDGWIEYDELKKKLALQKKMKKEQLK